jgi:hypothetical protein
VPADAIFSKPKRDCVNPVRWVGRRAPAALANEGRQRRQPVDRAEDLAADGSHVHLARPAHDRGGARMAPSKPDAKWPRQGRSSHSRRASAGVVIAAPDDDRVAGDTRLIESAQQLAGAVVELGQHVLVDAADFPVKSGWWIRGGCNCVRLT